MNRNKFIPLKRLERHHLLETVTMNDSVSKTLKNVYVDLLSAILKAHQSEQWLTMARLMDVAGDLCWKINEFERDATVKEESAP